MRKVTARSYGTIYRRIVDLPLKNFKRCIVHGDYTALIVKGYPDPNKIAEAWGCILIEYADAIADGEARMELVLEAEYMELKITYRIAIDLIEILSEMYEPELYKEEFLTMLNELLRTDYFLDPEDRDEYFKTLGVLYNVTKDLSLEIRIKENELAAVANKNETGQYTDEYFATHLITLSDFAGYRITEDISTHEYCNRINRLLKHNKEVQSRKK